MPADAYCACLRAEAVAALTQAAGGNAALVQALQVHLAIL